MKPAKIFLILSLLGILVLILIANLPKEQTATIKSINYYENKIEIQTKELNETLVVFDNTLLNLKEGDQIIFTGKQSEYRSEKQIIIGKIETFISK